MNEHIAVSSTHTRMGDRVKHPGAAGDPLDALIKEHEEGLKLLAKMEESALAIEHNGFSAVSFARIKHLMQKINVNFRRHMIKEEKYLFPLLARHTDHKAASVHTEHWDLWRSYNELLLCVKDVEEGRLHGKSIVEFLRVTNGFIGQFREHIEKEASMVFPLVRKLLTSQEYEELRDSIAARV